MLSRFLTIDGYEIVEQKFSVERSFIEVIAVPTQEMICRRCDSPLGTARSKHRLRVQDLPVMTYKNFIVFYRRKGHCPKCNKIRSEKVHFIAEETPHLTKQYVWWLGRLTEISTVKQAADLTELDKSTLFRIDLDRLRTMLQRYQIPDPVRISVDEVYAKRTKKEGEDRDDKFMTVITDLDTKKVIWVEQSRKEEALTRFFFILGEQRCQKIKVVALDQHRGYHRAVLKSCPNAVIVWDRFHIMQGFNEALNDSRKLLRKMLPKKQRSKLLDGKWRFIFLKKATRRTADEVRHMDDVMKENELFVKLELIKERMLTFFDCRDEKEAQQVFTEIGRWIQELGIPPLKKWYLNLRGGWDTLKNYFQCRVTSALAEGINNVIKAIKRRSYGFRNMEYFRLKIMQVCGYLNSKCLTGLLFPGHRISPQY